MKYLNLSQGKCAIVDDEDFEYLNQWKWSLDRGYAGRNVTIQKHRVRISMHRLIMNVPKNMQVDHINHNKLDNRKENLRICTWEQNSRNFTLLKTNTSGFKGVSWKADRKKWVSYIHKDGKNLYLGLYKDKRDAAKAYNQAAKKYFGEFAYLNQI